MMPPLPTLRDVRFLHADPFGEDMRHALAEDLGQALWARFMVCYFNQDGLAALSPSLGRLLRDPRSRGLFTLTCACGSAAIEQLAAEVRPPPGRLRAFLPLDGDGRDDAKLLHTKLLVLVRPRRHVGAFESPLEVVLYVGSHNWTGPGLRVGGGTANVEASVRIVADWDPAQEERWIAMAERGEVSGNPILDALTQMHRCFQLASNTDLAGPEARAELYGWVRANCVGEVEPPGATPFIVLTGVLAHEVDAETSTAGTHREAAPWARVPRPGEWLYVQHYTYGEEPEVFDSTVTWAVLLWESVDALDRGEQPWLLLGRARNLGQRDSGDPNLRTLHWLAYDPPQNRAAIEPRGGRRGSDRPPQRVIVGSHRLRSGTALAVEHWSVAPVALGTTSGDLNAKTPDRHVLVEILAVRAPTGGSTRGVGHTSWQGTELPFHQGKRRKRRRCYVVHDLDGRPSPERAYRMREEQARLFGLDRPAPGREPEKGPSGVGSYQADVFECVAPLNDLLFRVYQGEAVEARRLAGDRAPVVFQVARASGDDGALAERVVPRMERLIAPGVPHVAEALGLDGIVLERLGLGDGA